MAYHSKKKTKFRRSGRGARIPSKMDLIYVFQAIFGVRKITGYEKARQQALMNVQATD